MKKMAMAVVFFIFCPAVLLIAQQTQPGVALTPVAGPVYMIQGGGGNIGFVADPAGALMIDSMDESSTGQIRSAIKALPGGDHLRFLINTHWHGDHSDGNKVLGPGAVIIAHENVRSLLARDQSLLGQQVKALPPSALPNITYSVKLSVYAGGESVRLVHYANAHTNGDTVVFIDKANIVHMGDMFFNGLFPFLDVANGGDIVNWVRQLDTILAVLPPGVKIIPGHGPLAGAADLKAFRDMLNDSAETVRKQMKEGKTLEQIKAAGLPDRFTPWTKGFLPTPQWLELVYRSLEKKDSK